MGEIEFLITSEKPIDITDEARVHLQVEIIDPILRLAAANTEAAQQPGSNVCIIGIKSIKRAIYKLLYRRSSIEE